MLLLSHRGYHVEHPENTLAAFDAARALRLDGIETDIRLSADGQLVLFHDRHAPGGQSVAALTRDELCRQVGYTTPTLEEALEVWTTGFWNLEVKTPEALEGTLEIVRRRRATHRFLITSFWHDVVDRARQAVDVDCGFLVAHRPLDVAHDAAGWWQRAGQVRTIVWKYECLDRGTVNRARRHGVRSLVYGLETPADHYGCRELEVDGVITDRPEFALAAGMLPSAG